MDLTLWEGGCKVAVSLPEASKELGVSRHVEKNVRVIKPLPILQSNVVTFRAVFFYEN